MNTRRIFWISIVVVLLTAACTGGNTHEVPIPNSSSAPEEETEKETFELEEYGTVAVTAGVLQAGKSYYFVPGTAASGGISVYSIARGGIIGYLIERLFETGPGMIQDLTEGPRTFYWDGQFTSINRATGEVRIFALEDAYAAEAEAENAGENEEAKAKEEEKVSESRQLKLVFICEDDPSWISNLTEIFVELFGAVVKVFTSCEDMLVRLDSGENPDLFIVDHHLAGAIGGPKCTEEIRIRRPKAVIMGFPGDKGRKSDEGVTVEQRFIDNGANSVIEKGDTDSFSKITDFVKENFDTQ